MAKKLLFRRCMKKATVMLLVILQIVSICLASVSVSAVTSEDGVASRLINVVYDDSNSMIKYESTAWSEAKYSLEILSAMMQAKDTMNVYFMSDYVYSASAAPRISNISGAEAQKQSNIQKIHNTVSNTGGTYFLSIKKAYEDLQSKGASYDERHLVVLTDGNSFNNNEDGSDLDKLFKDAKDKGIKVIYLAIGEQTIKPTANENNGVYVYQAKPNNPTGSDSILNRVTEIGERIFQRPAHPVSGNTLNLKVPVSEIVVFAQGANVNVGDIEGTKKSVSTAGLTGKDVDKASANPDNSQIKGIKNIRVASGLSGSVATFTAASGDYIPEGTYNLNITATSYTVYYKPKLDVQLDIQDKDGNKVQSGSEVNIGEYKANYYLTYPEGHAKHGEELSLSDLGISPQYVLTVNNGGDAKTLEGPGPKTVELGKGNTEITVTANYLTYISTDQSVSLAVEDLQVHELKVEVTPNKKECMLSELEKDTEGFTVKVSLPDGEQLTPDLWADAKLTLTAEGLDFFEPVKNSDYTFTVRPKRKDGDYKKTASGDIPFKAGVSIEKKESKVVYKGTGDATLNIYNDLIPDDKNGFKIDIIELTEGIKSGDFNGSSPTAKIEISWNGNPLTKGQYDALKLTAAMKEDFKVKDSNGNEVSLISISEVKLDPYKEGEKTTATIKFTANGDAETQRTNLAKYDDFVITAVIDREGIKNEAKKEDSLDVSRTLSTFEIILIIIIILAILFILFGYIILKKWLPFKVYYRDKRNMYRPLYLYKNITAIITALIPFAPVSTKICVVTTQADKTRITPVLYIKAHDRRRKKAVVTNALPLFKDNGVYVDASKVTLEMIIKDEKNKKNNRNATKTQKKRKNKPILLGFANSRLYKMGDPVATFSGTKYRSRMKKK